MGQEGLTSFRSKKLQDRKARAAQQREAAQKKQLEDAGNKNVSDAILPEEKVVSATKEPETEVVTAVMGEVPDEVLPEKKEETIQAETDLPLMGTTEHSEALEKREEAEKWEQDKNLPVDAAETDTIKKPLTSFTPVKEKAKEKDSKKSGRKKVIEEERKTVYIKSGDEAYLMVRKAANWSRTTRNDYMCNLIENEMKLYEKNPESYISSRSKKVEEMEKKVKTGNKSISFKAGYHIIDFLNDITYDVDGTIDSYIRSLILMDYERKLKERSK